MKHNKITIILVALPIMIIFPNIFFPVQSAFAETQNKQEVEDIELKELEDTIKLLENAEETKKIINNTINLYKKTYLKLET